MTAAAAATVAAGAFAQVGCSPRQEPPRTYARKQRVMFGTLVTIQAHGRSAARTARAVARALELMRSIERDTNNFDASSTVSRLNAGAGRWRKAPRLVPVVEASLALARQTKGAFDPTIWPVTKLWDFGGRQRVPAPAELRRALALVGWRRVKLRPSTGEILLPVRGMGLDLGGVAKGYAVQRAVDFLGKAGVRGALVTAGSTTAVFGGNPGGKPWKIGIEDPRAPRKMIGVISVRDGTVSTSGDYQNYFIHGGVRYHHILDPATGLPVRHTISATIVGNSDATSSDILSTAVFVMGFDAAARLIDSRPGDGIVFVTPDRRVRTAGNLEGRLSSLAGRI